MIATITEKNMKEGPGTVRATVTIATTFASPALNRLRSVGGAAIVLLALSGLLAACRSQPARTRSQVAQAKHAELIATAIQVDGRQRSFTYYVPSNPAQRPPVILAFHGSGGSGARLRGFMGGELERLAEQRGFIAVYPEGFEGNWNGCRAPAPSSANRLGIDDAGFVHAMLAWLTRELGADPSRVYAIGFSGGGHMAYRLALEIPEEIPAIAAIAASLPVEEELDCQLSGRPVSVMIVNGTADPVNPYGGGEVVAPGGTRLGHVRSTRATAEYFAALAGLRQAPSALTLAPREAGGTGVDRATWAGGSGLEVRLYTIRGGGHTIPGPRSQLPDFVGLTERRFSAIREALMFLLGPRWRPPLADAATAGSRGER
ncbi:MAG: PHB depolymerase family esterase [Gemmatimonadales bacterium]|jgi:polyhydroxybutyrate depolymerase